MKASRIGGNTLSRFAAGDMGLQDGWKRWAALPVLILTMLFGYAAPAGAAHSGQPVGEQGVIDANGWDFTSGPIKLDGVWEFYWLQLLDPGALATAAKPEYVRVPQVWGRPSDDGKSYPKFGYATYHLTIRIAASDVDRMMGIYMPSVATAYSMWIDGEHAGGNGVVGTSRESMTASNYSKVYYFRPHSDRVDLTIQVSNFVQRKGGLWEPILLGDSRDITELRERHILYQLLIASALLVMGIYHAFLIGFRRRDILSSVLAVLCLMLAIRMLTTGDILLALFFPGLSWELTVKLEYLSPFISIPLFSVFMLYMYPAESNRLVTRIILLVGAAFSLLVLATPARIYTLTMQTFEAVILVVCFYYIFICVMAAVHRREGALMNVVALLVMFAAVLNDILFYNHLISSMDFAPWGVFVFVFAQTLIVAMKFSKAFYQVENLSSELKEVNMNLEEKIAERTAQLAGSNEQLTLANEHLVQEERMRRRLITNISHELGTPMTSIQGYLQAMLDGVIDPGDPKYVRMIYEKAAFVNRLTRDLFELSKLEAQQVIFNYDAVGEAEFMQLFDKFAADVAERSIKFVVSQDVQIPPGLTFQVRIDSFRIEQVIGNILYNAIKFTQPGGEIEVSVEAGEATKVRTATSALVHQTTEGNLEHEEDGGRAGVLTVKISDTGPGIDEESVSYLFERFYKGKNKAPRRMDGSGLGLSIAKEIVLLHGGTIGAVNREGGGSTFYFELPATLLPLGD
ncbi:MAG: integral rane sensor signal transduction histidine kinase, partial [Paenibacillaceae bacterium]|jgi:signal transduction histidine kinase|nr:integral rane sensor signal transduction histidine kinase [Paenibacillaceae bacterium]